jgi:hypothetical protein
LVGYFTFIPVFEKGNPKKEETLKNIYKWLKNRYIKFIRKFPAQRRRPKNKKNLKLKGKEVTFNLFKY